MIPHIHLGQIETTKSAGVIPGVLSWTHPANHGNTSVWAAEEQRSCRIRYESAKERRCLL